MIDHSEYIEEIEGELDKLSEDDSRRVLQGILEECLRLIEPVEPESVCDWADKHRFLSSEASDVIGQWDTDKCPWHRGVDKLAWMNRKCRIIVLMWAAQCAKTEFVLNVILWIVEFGKRGTTVFFPTDDMAEKDFSVLRLEPMIRDCPKLREKFIDVKLKNTQKSRIQKTYRGGYIRLAGANKGTKTKSRPTKYALFDEMSCEYNTNRPDGGDSVGQIIKRLTNFLDTKFMASSTPGDKSNCPTYRLFKTCKRHIFKVPCPECGKKIQLIWKGVVWDSGKPETARYKCNLCKNEFNLDAHKRKMNLGGEWEVYPEDKEKTDERMGFHISALYSPWVSLSSLVSKFLESQGHTLLTQFFVTHELGEPYEEGKEGVDHNILYHRREVYKAEVPEGGLYLVCGVDINGGEKGMHWQVVAYGAGYESWVIDAGKFNGDMGSSYVWDRLESEVLNRQFTHEYGFKIGIECMTIDMRGHYHDKVFEFSKKHLKRRVFAVAGVKGWNTPFLGPVRGKRKGRGRRPVPLFPIGSSAGKFTIYTRLKKKKEGPGYIHFPEAYEDSNGEKIYRDYISKEYFEGLTSEVIKPEPTKSGEESYIFVLPEGLNNEPLDTFNYAMAALEILKPNFEGRKRLFLRRKKDYEELLSKGFSEDDAGELEKLKREGISGYQYDKYLKWLESNHRSKAAGNSITEGVNLDEWFK